MFERFTDKARRVLVLAQEDARVRQHDFLGTEHMLIGIITEATVATDAIRALGGDLDEIRRDLVNRMPPGRSAAGAPPFTPKAKRAIELSLREALSLGHNYIGTEHLLLGLVHEGEGLAAQVLTARDLSLDDLRRTIVRLLQERGQTAPATVGDPPMPASTPGALSPAADTVLRGARARAGRRPIGTHDLLAAILYADRSAAVVALQNAGFDVDAMRAAAERATTLDTSDRTPEETVAGQLHVSIDGSRIVLSIEDETLLAAMQGKPLAELSGSNPAIAHDLGTLWHGIHTTLGEAIDRLRPPEAS
jgi:ATP-dependent Clp protease ATP-binding subunit ClpC